MRKTDREERKGQDGDLCSGIISESMYSAEGGKQKVV